MLSKLRNKYREMPEQLKASFWFLVCAFLQKGISCLTTPIFTRLLNTAEYGQFNVFSSWFSILLVIVSLNLWGGVYMQGMVKFEDKKEQYGSALQGLTLVLVLLWTIVYIVTRRIWNQLFSLSTPQMLAMFVLIWTGSVFSFWSSSERVDFKYKKLVIVTIIVSLLRPILGIVFVILADDKVTARIMSMVLVEVVAFTGCFVVQLKKGKQFYSREFWSYALKFNIPLVPHYLSMSVLSSADRIMISKMCGESEAGLYSLAYNISLIMTMFNSSLLQTLEPWIYKKIKSKNIEDIANVAYPAFGAIAAVNIVLILFAPEVVAIFAPSEYYDAIWVIPPVSMSVFFMFAYTFFATFEFYYEKQKNIVMATLAGAVLNIVLNYIFIDKFGYVAAGYTTLVCYVIYALLHYLFMRQICKQNLDNRQPYSLKVLLMITVTFVFISVFVMAMYTTVVSRYVIILIFIVGLYMKKQEVINILKKIINTRKTTDV